ncbi:MAG: ATP-binding protein [Brevinematales bacterium]
MNSEIFSIVIDYSILIFHKFNLFIAKKNFKADSKISSQLKSQAFIVREHSFPEFRATIARFNPSAEKLTFEEKKIVLLLLGASLYGQNGINIWQAMCFFHRIPFRAMKAVGQILDPHSGVLKSGIMMFQETDFLGASLSIEEIAEFYNNRKVFLSPVALNSLFSDFTGKNLYGVTNYTLSEKYKNIDILLNDISSIMKYLFFLSNFYKVNSAYSSSRDDIYENGEFADTLRKFRKNIVSSGLKINLKSFLKKNNFTNIEFVVLLYFIYKVVIMKEFMINSVEEVLTSLAFIPSQIKMILGCFSRDNVFLRDKFIEVADFYPGLPFDDGPDDEMENENQEDDEYQIIGFTQEYNAISISKDRIYYLLFSEQEAKKKKTGEDDKNRVRDKKESGIDQKNKGLYEIVEPAVKICDVILDEDVKKELLGAVDLARAADMMKKWGIRPNLASKSFGSVKILLYGPSGTGKTVTAQALAGEVGADLFKVDASNLVSSWVGESTKNVKKVFREFYKYAKISKKKIFLFMNEADQLLSARGTITQAADKEYNQMQNILLEELENFDGVFLATTNLADLFDTAWNRRFNIKIKFDVPKYETRLKLWKVHISEKMPLGDDVNFEKLAEYELAGGSIANVIYNAARRAALREVQDRIVRQKDFIDSVQNELKSHLGHKNSKVGFSQ